MTRANQPPITANHLRRYSCRYLQKSKAHHGPTVLTQIVRGNAWHFGDTPAAESPMGLPRAFIAVCRIVAGNLDRLTAYLPTWPR